MTCMNTRSFPQTCFRHSRLVPVHRVMICTQAQHFRRESLYSTGLTEPEDILQHCLTLFRKADVLQLVPYLPSSTAQSAISGAVHSHIVGASVIYEQGPLSSLADILDVGARRVLPGHILRRSRVLGSLRLSPDIFRQIISLSARNGEECVFEWTLYRMKIQQYVDNPEQAHLLVINTHGGTPASSSKGISAPTSSPTSADSDIDTHRDGNACSNNNSDENSNENEYSTQWIVQSIKRDPGDISSLPTTPHPKVSPELVIRAQLTALQQGDIFEASIFTVWEPLTHKTGGRRRFTLGQNYEILRDMLQDYPHSILLYNEEFILTTAAIPTQHSMLQEVAVKGKGMPWVTFVWRLALQPNGCWMTTGIVPILENTSEM